MKKIVVSALFGGHDYLKDPVLDGYNPDWEYHLFTDNPNLQSDYWTIHLMAGDVTTARKIKIQTNKYVKYDVRLWMDMSMVLKVNPEEILTFMGDADFCVKIHPERETTFQEIDAAIDYKRMSPSYREPLREMFNKLGYTEAVQNSTLIYETGLNMMRNTSSMVEFCAEWLEFTEICANRDQIALPYVIYKLRPKLSLFTQQDWGTWVGYSYHNQPDVNLPDINYVEPFSINGNLGEEYNMSCRGMDDDEWICILDQDVCFLDSRVKLWISKTVAANPEIDVFTCMTNRLSNGPQIVKVMYNVNDIVKHKLKTVERFKKFGTKIVAPTQPTAGLMMLMKVRTLKAVQFKNGLQYLDTDFYIRATNEGFKFGIMQGIYLYHYYRFAEGKNNIKHLMRSNFK